MTIPVSLWIESGDAATLNTAPALLSRAPHGSEHHARYLGGLAAALIVRYQRGDDPARAEHPTRVPADPLKPLPERDPADLDGAIEAARGALAALPADDPDRPWVATTLAVALALRYERSGNLVELGEALALARSAAGTRQPSVDAARGTLLAWAAHTYATRSVTDARRRDLRGRNLSGHDLRDADLGGADLTGARLVGTDLTGANLAGATLAGARLDRARLVGAVLSGADLTDAWLTGADLTDAHLTAARLDRTVLAKATMDQEALTGTRCRRALVPPSVRLLAARPTARHPDAAPTVIAATGDLVATGHEDAAIRLWDAATGTLLRERPYICNWSPDKGFESAYDEGFPPRAEIVALAFTPDGGRLAGLSTDMGSDYGVISYSADLVVWNLGGRWDEPAWSHKFWDEVWFDDWAHKQTPRSVELTFSPDGRSLALGAHHPPGTQDHGIDRAVDVWDTANRGPRWSLATDTDEWHRCIAHSPDSRLIVAGCFDTVLGEYSVAARHTVSGAPAGRWSTGSEAVLAVAFADGDRVCAATCGRQRWSAWQWGLDTGDDGEPWHREGPITAAAYSPDGHRLAVATGDRVALCDPATGAELWSLPVEAVIGPQVWSVSSRTVTELRFAPDGRWLAAGTEQAIRIYDTTTGTALPGAARAVAFVPDGYWAIHPDGSVHLHDTTGTAIRDLDPHRATKAGWRIAGLRLLHPDDLDRTSTD